MKKILFPVFLSLLLLPVCQSKVDIEKTPLSDLTPGKIVKTYFFDLKNQIEKDKYIKESIVGKKIKWNFGKINRITTCHDNINTPEENKCRGKYFVSIKGFITKQFQETNSVLGDSHRFIICLYSDDEHTVNLKRGQKITYEGIIKVKGSEPDHILLHPARIIKHTAPKIPRKN